MILSLVASGNPEALSCIRHPKLPCVPVRRDPARQGRRPGRDEDGSHRSSRGSAARPGAPKAPGPSGRPWIGDAGKKHPVPRSQTMKLRFPSWSAFFLEPAGPIFTRKRQSQPINPNSTLVGSVSAGTIPEFAVLQQGVNENRPDHWSTNSLENGVNAALFFAEICRLEQLLAKWRRLILFGWNQFGRRAPTARHRTAARKVASCQTGRASAI